MYFFDQKKAEKEVTEWTLNDFLLNGNLSIEQSRMQAEKEGKLDEWKKLYIKQQLVCIDGSLVATISVLGKNQEFGLVAEVTKNFVAQKTELLQQLYELENPTQKSELSGQVMFK